MRYGRSCRASRSVGIFVGTCRRFCPSASTTPGNGSGNRSQVAATRAARPRPSAARTRRLPIAGERRWRSTADPAGRDSCQTRPRDPDGWARSEGSAPPAPSCATRRGARPPHPPRSPGCAATRPDRTRCRRRAALPARPRPASAAMRHRARARPDAAPPPGPHRSPARRGRRRWVQAPRPEARGSRSSPPPRRRSGGARPPNPAASGKSEPLRPATPACLLDPYGATLNPSSTGTW